MRKFGQILKDIKTFQKKGKKTVLLSFKGSSQEMYRKKRGNWKIFILLQVGRKSIFERGLYEQ